jgi:hypothetical protein
VSALAPTRIRSGLPAAPAALRSLGSRPAVWVAVGVVITIALRAAFLDAALGHDEGGDLMVALAWHHRSGPFLYGPYFLDRPPLLVELYWIAGKLGGVTGIRVLGTVAASAAVAITTLLAVRVAGRRAAPFAAVIAAVSMSALAAMAVYTPAELLAIVPSSLSILLLVIGIQRDGGGRLLFAGAGLSAAAALLVKQSFGDALVAGVAALLALALVRGTPRREVLLRAASYLAGLIAAGVALAIWALAVHASAHSLWYAVAGFRIDAAHALSHGDLGSRFSRLARPTYASGLAIALPLAAIGIATLRVRLAARVALGAWLLAGVVGIVLGGSYWPHYVIELMPVAAVGAAALLSRRPVLGVVGLALIALSAIVVTVPAARADQSDTYQHNAVTVGNYVRLRAEPHQTAWVMYANVNTLYYTRLPSPFPYHWALMLQALPHMRRQIATMLASPSRPTWVIRWNGPKTFGVDRVGRIAPLLRRHYHLAAVVCGHRVLLERGVPARSAPPMTGRCELSAAVLPRPS